MLTVITVLPIACLLILLMVLKLSAVKASIYTFCLTAAICFIYYKYTVFGAVISTLKGFSLSLFVILIIWGAIFLYNLASEAGALDVIGKNINIIINEQFLQFLLLSWIFAPFLQGIAGFGVPVVITVPFLLQMGIEPVKAAAAVLIGHSWAISFGSMGSSIYAINMVTQTDIGDITKFMVPFGTIGMFFTGLTVCYIYGGFSFIIKKALTIAVVTICMCAVMTAVVWHEMLSLIGILTASGGIAAVMVINKIKSAGKPKKELYRAGINVAEAVMPYALIVILSLFFFFLSPKLAFSFNFPGYQTMLGHVVDPAAKYVTINILKHPCSIILMASAISVIVYVRKQALESGSSKKILRATVKKCWPITIALMALLGTAVLMMDSGMIGHIANELVRLTGGAYPLVAPFIGLLGVFVTGSNTNSNVLFGSLQETAALALGLNAATVCASQSIGASVGVALGPTMIALGATAAQIQGQEYKIYRVVLLPTLLIILLLGAANLAIHAFI